MFPAVTPESALTTSVAQHGHSWVCWPRRWNNTDVLMFTAATPVSALTTSVVQHEGTRGLLQQHLQSALNFHWSRWWYIQQTVSCGIWLTLNMLYIGYVFILQKQYRSLPPFLQWVCMFSLLPFVYPIFWGWAPPLPVLAGHAELSFISSVTSFLLGKAPPLQVLAGYAESTRRPGSMMGLPPKIFMQNILLCYHPK